MFQVTREAESKKESNGSLDFLQCLVAWSGWFQRPWPFCATISDARRLLKAAKANKGRTLSRIEEILLELANSDAELLNGGFADDAGKGYLNVLRALDEAQDLLNGTTSTLIKAHCKNGLARVCQLGITLEETASVEMYARNSLDAIESLEISQDMPPFHLWNSQSLFSMARSHQLSVSRQLMADSLVQNDRCDEAQEFLQAAVNDSPSDADAALAFGAFLLRMAFYVNEERSPEADKAAQIHLLKSAKLDSSRAEPFSLLGLWFEVKGDLQRAHGCYSKALNLDASNPVAGRGLLRVGSRENLKDVLDNAINTKSPLNGWAFRAVGLNKILVDAEDNLAVVALLKSLRCRDIAQPSSEPLGIFYRPPSDLMQRSERADGLAEVAMCYRRLGRFTAAIRAYHAAIAAAGNNVSPSVLCSCAQGKTTQRNTVAC